MRNRYCYYIFFLLYIKLCFEIADNSQSDSNSLEKNCSTQKNVSCNKELNRETKVSQSDASLIKPRDGCFKKKLVNKVRSWNNKDGKSTKKAEDVTCAGAVSK